MPSLTYQFASLILKRSPVIILTFRIPPTALLKVPSQIREQVSRATIKEQQKILKDIMGHAVPVNKPCLGGRIQLKYHIKKNR